MDSRAGFKQLSPEAVNAEINNAGGIIAPVQGFHNPGPTGGLRGIERNTARGVNDGAPETLGVTEIPTDGGGPGFVCDPFETYGDL